MKNSEKKGAEDDASVEASSRPTQEHRRNQKLVRNARAQDEHVQMRHPGVTASRRDSDTWMYLKKLNLHKWSMKLKAKISTTRQ